VVSEDFYGVEITIAEDSTTTAKNCGGYERRLMSVNELRPWVRLAESLHNAEKAAENMTCIAA
jgi:hypothetical protein